MQLFIQIRNNISLLVTLFVCLLIPPESKADWQLQGQTRFTYWFWDVYDIGYWRQTMLESGKTTTPSRLISLRYHRDILAKDLVQETSVQWQRVGLDHALAEDWLRQLGELWPNVKANDRIDFQEFSDGVCFFYNGRYMGRVIDKNFINPFFNIWIGEQTEYPRQRKALLHNGDASLLPFAENTNCE